MTHFSLHSFGWETVAVQLMNDFPRWKPDELRLVARRTDIPPNKLEGLYLKSWRMIRESALDRQKHQGIRSTDSGFIHEIEGQAWDQAKNANPFSGSRPPPFNEPPKHQYGFDERAAEKMYRDFFAGDPEFERMFRGHPFGGTASTGTGGLGGTGGAAEKPKSGPTTMEEMLRKAAGHGPWPGFDTRKPWGGAPAYLHMHFEVLQMMYPISMDDAKKQFRKRAMETHPDRNPTKTDEFKKVMSAWDLVKEFLERQ